MNDAITRNYQDIWWIIWPLLILWWLPLLVGSVFGLFNRPGRGAAAAAADAPVAGGGGLVTGGLFSITQDLARIARDAFIVIVFGLLLSEVLSGGMDHGVWASAWAAFAFFILWWILALVVGWVPIIGPLGGGFFGLGFVVSILSLYAHAFKYYRSEAWWWISTP